jgi:hypothetical protein
MLLHDLAMYSGRSVDTVFIFKIGVWSIRHIAETKPQRRLATALVAHTVPYLRHRACASTQFKGPGIGYAWIVADPGIMAIFKFRPNGRKWIRTMFSAPGGAESRA